MKPLYEATGGGWYGFMLQGSWPFCKLVIFPDRLEFSLAAATKVLSWNEISYARRLFILPFLADGIAIIPKDRKPKILVFWSMTSDQILNLLRSKGVSTTTPYSSDILPIIIFARAFPIIILLFFIFGVVTTM